MSPFDWPITKKSLNYEGFPKYKIVWKDQLPTPLAHLIGEKWEDFGQNIWGFLSEVAIGNALGEHIENLGNILGTYWEHIGNLK
jgi:hypothetical protein